MMYQINSRSFLSWWIASSLFVWPLAFVMALPAAFFAMAIFNTSLWSGSYWDDYGPLANGLGYFIANAIMAGGIGAMIGLAVGMLQKWLIGRHLYYELPRWRKLSLIGGAIGGPVAWACNTYFADWIGVSYISSGPYYGLPGILYGLLPMTVFAFFLGLLQFVDLRRFVEGAWLWILGNVIGGVVFSMVAVNNPRAGLEVWLVAMACQGAVTGGVLLWLFQTAVREDVEFQTVGGYELEIEPMPKREPSIWDEAI